MQSFIKPLPNHWRPADFDLAAAAINQPVQHIAKTVCLLEARCDDYAEYLRLIVADRSPQWSDAINQWNAEECQHGEVLRLLSEAADPAFQFDSLMERYTSLVSYHLPTGRSVRGSLSAELVSRCVVEALASTLYRVMAEATDQDDSRRVFTALARDEARHFGMFLRMLNAEAEVIGRIGVVVRCRYAIRRILALEDEQIMVASCVVAGRGEAPIHLRSEANWYIVRSYGLYRWRHLRYASRMLLQSVGVRPTIAAVGLCTITLWVGLKLRWTWARCGRTDGAS